MKIVLTIIKWMFITIFSLTIVLALLIFFYMKHDKFGKAPEGKRLELISQSPNFRDGSFQNIHHTPELTEGHSIMEVTYEFIFNKVKRRSPSDIIPGVKTDLINLPADSNVLVWFGHSSYFIQLDGKTILVDPVFSGNASPVPGTTKSFQGTDRYTVDDLPEIDYLFISHDHYDHVDYETIINLRSKTRKVICGLGVGSHFEHWGYSQDIILEKDWNERVNLDSGFVVHTKTARHFSGRGFSRNNTLWMSYVLQTPSMTIYIGGDSGYDTHYKEIGEEFDDIDLAILDNGQYDEKWRYIHTHPHEVLQATKDLGARRLFPVHSSKFILGNHAWDEPLVKITELNKNSKIPLVTPVIGEIVNLKDHNQKFSEWWVGLE